MLFKKTFHFLKIRPVHPWHMQILQYSDSWNGFCICKFPRAKPQKKRKFAENLRNAVNRRREFGEIPIIRLSEGKFLISPLFHRLILANKRSSLSGNESKNDNFFQILSLQVQQKSSGHTPVNFQKGPGVEGSSYMIPAFGIAAEKRPTQDQS